MNHRVQFEAALKELDNYLREMGAIVEQGVREAVQSLANRDLELAQKVIEVDKTTNRLENNVMELGAKIIATQQPVAKDMRRILTAFRIASDLERMGDLAVDIAKVTVRLGGQELIKPLVDIPRMAEIAQLMVIESMQAYMQENVDLAYKMAKMDDEVDHLYAQMLRELFVFMIENPSTINQGMLLSFVGRYLERFADHATNIGESVVYLVKNVRPDLN